MEAKREAMVVCGHGACLESLSSAGVQNRFPLSHHREPKCLCLNAECKTEQLLGDIKLKNISITPDKDFIITLLKYISLDFADYDSFPC